MNKIGRVWYNTVDFFFPNKNDHIADFLPEAPPKPSNYPEGFTTDGCSGGMSLIWRKVLRRVPPWEGCCVKHDLAYWRGGFWMDRKQADLELMMCVKRAGHPIWAILIYIGVRLGGTPIWPFPWRWGYGWDYTGRYEKRDEAERTTSPSQEGQ